MVKEIKFKTDLVEEARKKLQEIEKCLLIIDNGDKKKLYICIRCRKNLNKGNYKTKFNTLRHIADQHFGIKLEYLKAILKNGKKNKSKADKEEKERTLKYEIEVTNLKVKIESLEKYKKELEEKNIILSNEKMALIKKIEGIEIENKNLLNKAKNEKIIFSQEKEKLEKDLISLSEENKRIKNSLNYFKSYTENGFLRELLTSILDDENLLKEEVFNDCDNGVFNDFLIDMKKVKNYANNKIHLFALAFNFAREKIDNNISNSYMKLMNYLQEDDNCKLSDFDFEENNIYQKLFKKMMEINPNIPEPFLRKINNFYIANSKTFVVCLALNANKRSKI